MMKLVIQDDQGQRTSVPLVREEISIGRKEGNTIRLTEENVSRTHARLLRDGDKLFIEDESRYGTRKNNKRIRERSPFQIGDVVMIGDYRLFLKRDDAAASDGADEFASSDTEPHMPSPIGENATGESSRHGTLLGFSSPFRDTPLHLPDQAILVVGRGETADLHIDHRSISKRHALLRIDAAGHVLEDLNSANGVFVNGEAISTAWLRTGDRIEFGQVAFRYIAPGDAIALPPAEAIDESASSAGRPAWAMPVVIGGTLLAVVAIVLIFVLRDGPAETPSTAQAEEPEREQAAAPSAPTPRETPRSADFATGQRLSIEGRWQEAIDAFNRVESDDANHELAASLRMQAENEMARESIYRDVVALAELGLFGEALDRFQEIPVGTFYHSLAVSEQLERRILNGLVEEAIDASLASEDTGNLREARRVIEEARAWTPNDERLLRRLRELDARATQRERPAPREAASEPAAARPERTAAAPTTPQRTNNGAASATAAEPAAEPAGDPVQRANELKAEARRVIVSRDHRTAIRLLEEARSLNSRDPDIDQMLFANYRAIGNHSRAAQAISRFLRSRPDDPRRAEFEAYIEEHGR